MFKMGMKNIICGNIKSLQAQKTIFHRWLEYSSFLNQSEISVT